MQWLIRRRDELGRKFTSDDSFSPSEVASMCDWLRSYRGEFGFLTSLRDTLLAFENLSSRQLSGLANSIYANERNNTRLTLDETPDRPVTVNFDEETNVPEPNFGRMASLSDVLEVYTQLGRRFEGNDLFTPGVVAFAYDYLVRYRGQFQFLVDLRTRLAADGRLKSTAQIAGILNCAVAQVQRQATQSQQWSIPNGYYTVKFPDGSHVTFRIQEHWDEVERGRGSQVVGFLSGPNNESDYTNFATLRLGSLNIWKRFYDRVEKQVIAWNMIKDGSTDEYGRAYALESGRCYRCNRLLTTPESIERGLGPICAEII